MMLGLQRNGQKHFPAWAFYRSGNAILGDPIGLTERGHHAASLTRQNLA